MHVFEATAFLAHVSYAPASFFGFADDGGVAESMHEAAPDEQLWIESRTDWQSESLPHAFSCFAQVLSTHFAQSVLPNEGAGGGLAAAGSALAVSAGGASAADADSAGAALSDAAGLSLSLSESLSEAAVSGGLVSPPPACEPCQREGNDEEKSGDGEVVIATHVQHP